MKKTVAGLFMAGMIMAGGMTVQANEMLDIEENTMVITMDGKEHKLYLDSAETSDWRESMELVYTGIDEDGNPTYSFELRLIMGIEPGTYYCGGSDGNARNYTYEEPGFNYWDTSNMNMELYTDFSPLSKEWKKGFRASEFFTYDAFTGEMYDTNGDFAVQITYRSDDWMHYQGIAVAELEEMYVAEENAENVSVDSVYFDFTIGEQHGNMENNNQMGDKLEKLLENNVDSEESLPLENVYAEYEMQNNIIEEPYPIYFTETEERDQISTVECPWCFGDGKCRSCDGEGYTYKTKYSIDLTGEGGIPYEEKNQCTLCESTGSCYKCS